MVKKTILFIAGVFFGWFINTTITTPVVQDIEVIDDQDQEYYKSFIRSEVGCSKLLTIRREQNIGFDTVQLEYTAIRGYYNKD